MRQIVKEKLTFALKYSIGIILLIWILSRIDRQDLLSTFLNLGVTDIFVVFVIAVVNLAIQFHLWKFLVESHSQHLNLKDLLPSFMAGFAFRLIIPGGHAEVTKIFLLRGKKRGKVIAFGIEKFFQTFLKIILVLFAIPLVFPEHRIVLYTAGSLVILSFFILPFVLKKERFSKHQEKDVSYARIFLMSLAHSIPMFLCNALQYYYLLTLSNGISFFILSTLSSKLFTSPFWAIPSSMSSFSGCGAQIGEAARPLGGSKTFTNKNRTPQTPAPITICLISPPPFFVVMSSRCFTATPIPAYKNRCVVI